MPNRSDCGAYLWAGEERTTAKKVEKRAPYAQFVQQLQKSRQTSDEYLAELAAYLERLTASYGTVQAGFVSEAQRKTVFGDANRLLLQLEAVAKRLAMLLISLGNMEHELLLLRARAAVEESISPAALYAEWCNQMDGIVCVRNELVHTFAEAVEQAADLEENGAAASPSRFLQVLSVWTERVKAMHISENSI